MTVVTWQDANPVTSPGQCRFPGFAYDAVHNLGVLYGGDRNGFVSTRNTTWLWNGTNWTQAAPATVPSARTTLVMAWHGGSSKVVMFGGIHYPTVYNETWVWDGTNWTKLTPAHSPPAPGPLGGPGMSMAYDAVHDRCVLLVFDSTGTDQTWLWDGTDWNQQFPVHSPTHTQVGGGGVLAWDSANSRIVYLQTDTYPASGSTVVETWTWDGTDWTQLSPVHSPPARDFPFMAFDPGVGKVVLFGGDDFGLGPLADTWEWDGTDWTEIFPPASPPGRSAPMIGDTARNNLVVYGGYNDAGAGLQDTWRLVPVVAPTTIPYLNARISTV